MVKTRLLLSPNDAPVVLFPDGKQFPSEALLQKIKVSKKRWSRVDRCNGEKRCSATFEMFGVPGKDIQTCSQDLIVPDGLVVKHNHLGGNWLLTTRHEQHESGITLVRWTVTDRVLNFSCSCVETCLDALRRQKNNKYACAIASDVFHQARVQRREILTRLYNDAESPYKKAVYKARIDKCVTKRDSLGVLYFGLRHRILQAKMQELLDIAEL